MPRRNKDEDEFLVSFQPGEVKRIRGEDLTLDQYVDRLTSELRRRNLTPKGTKDSGYLIQQRRRRGRTEVYKVHEIGDEEESILEANNRRNKKNK